MIAVREFTVHTDQSAHYKAVQDRLNRPRRIVPAQLLALPEPEPEVCEETTEIPESSAPALALTSEQIDELAWARDTFAWNTKATANRMVAEVAARHGVDVADIMGPRRYHAVRNARFEAIALVANTFRGWSLPMLGRFFGGRDHTTILHTLRKMGARGYEANS